MALFFDMPETVGRLFSGGAEHGIVTVSACQVPEKWNGGRIHLKIIVLPKPVKGFRPDGSHPSVRRRKMKSRRRLFLRSKYYTKNTFIFKGGTGRVSELKINNVV